MVWTSRLRWDRRRPWLVDLGLSVVVAGPVVTAAFTLPPGPSHPIRVSDAGFVGAACALMFWRRRAPLLMLAAVTVLVVVCQAVGGVFESPVAALEVMLFGAAVRTSRVVAWTAAALVAVAVVGSGLIVMSGPVLDARRLVVIAWIGLATAIGDSARIRQAYVVALEERAVRAERTREQEAARRVVQERMRIAGELHDVVAHELTLINAQAGVGVHLREQKPELAADLLVSIRDRSKEALEELRSIVGLLGEPGEASREPVPGLDRLDELAESFARAGLEVEIVTDGELTQVPHSVGVTGYRIVQEALTNVHKHAGVASARVRLRYLRDQLSITVENSEAVRAPLAAGGTERGLIGMRERAAAVGGSVAAGPRVDGGFVVDARLPLGRGRVLDTGVRR